MGPCVTPSALVDRTNDMSNVIVEVSSTTRHAYAVLRCYLCGPAQLLLTVMVALMSALLLVVLIVVRFLKLSTANFRKTKT